jgi:hypothetical protein
VLRSRLQALADRLAAAAELMRGATDELPGLAILPDGAVRILPPTGRSALGRPLWIGGALTSAALSLAGAAYLAWRLRRPPNSAMARAVRAVARARLS